MLYILILALFSCKFDDNHVKRWSQLILVKAIKLLRIFLERTIIIFLNKNCWTIQIKKNYHSIFLFLILSRSPVWFTSVLVVDKIGNQANSIINGSQLVLIFFIEPFFFWTQHKNIEIQSASYIICITIEVSMNKVRDIFILILT